MNRIAEQDFYKIDHQVMRLAFDIHNEIGRLWDERIFRNELANRCRQTGFENAEIEVPVIVTHQGFVKRYFVDLVINDSVIYELKAVSKLSPEHDKQALHYLFLFGLQHGKLINFRPPSVEKRFVSTTLLPQDRYNIVVEDKHWLELDADSIWLKTLLIELLRDWGAYLETTLFYEAIYHFRGGEERVIQDIEIVLNDAKLGNQKVHLLNPGTAFKITALTKGIEGYQQNLNRFMRLTNLNALQWINFNHHVVSFKTIMNSKK